MGGALWNFLFFCIVLGILVTIHEFGHYLAARLCGVKVYRFCIGFGPVIFRKVRANGEEFAIALLPLGGYVKMKGESADVTALESAGTSATVSERAERKAKMRWGNLSSGEERTKRETPSSFETDFAQVRTGTFADSAFSTQSTKELVKEAERSARDAQAQLSDSFADKKIWQRTLIIAAGTVFNIILAFFIYVLINIMGVNARLPVVASILPGSIAAQGGFLNNDLITEIDGRPIYTAGDAWMNLGSFTGQDVALTVRSNYGQGPERQVSLDLQNFDLLQGNLFDYVGFTPSYGQMPQDISFVIADSPAHQAGLMPGDIFLEVNGQKVEDFTSAVAVLRADLRRQAYELLGPIPEEVDEAFINKALHAPYQPIEFKVLRRHWAQGTLPFDPAADVAANNQAAMDERYQKPELNQKWYAQLQEVAKARAQIAPTSSEIIVGSVMPRVTVSSFGMVNPSLGIGAVTLSTDGIWTEVQYGPVDAVVKGFNDTVNGSLLIFRAIEALFSGAVGVEAVSGPVAIATLAGESAALGLIQFLTFLAILSINLGWMNLIPIPVLDGGQLLYLAYEKVMGQPPSERVQNFLTILGLSLILGLTALALFNDLTYFWR